MDEIPLHINIYMSGNNITPCEDAHRRWLPINLVSGESEAYLREDLTEEDYAITDRFLFAP